MHFKSFDMLLELSFIFIVIATTTTAQVTELLDLPLTILNGELVIHANLYASSGKEKYSIKELISASESAITGKIVVSNDKDSYDIHYQFDRTGKDSKERLVIQGNDCTLYTHSKMTQNANLFGTNKPLRDLILLMGPSIINRLAGQSTVWSEATQKEIRGFNMKGATTTVHKTLAISIYYKDKYDTSYGVKHPTRIEFNGYEPSSYPPGEKLFLDIYLKQFNPAQFDVSKYKVQLSPGIGCPHYLSERKTMPVLVTKYIRFTMYEEIQGSTNTRTYSEVTASGKNLLMRLKTSLLGVETEVIYDNGLGIILTLEKGGHCQMKIGDKNSPGRNAKGYFKLENLLLVDGDFNYIGKGYFGEQFEFPVEAWESVQFNANFEGNKVDKFVVTQYFIESPNSAIFNGYSLVRTMISIYDSDSSKKSYVLAKRIKRDYMDLQTVEFEYELYDYFTLKDCKDLISDRKATLNFKLGCESRNTDCIKLADRRMYQFREEFKNEMVLYEPISPLRVDDIQYRSSDSHIEFDVTFLDKPNFDGIIIPQTMLVSSETFDVARTRSASSQRECLDQLGHVYGLFAVGIWRSSDSFCGYLKKFEDFKEDPKNGVSCKVYIFPLENYYHISHELALDDLQKSFLEDKFRTFSVKDPESQRSFSYKILDIVNVTEFQKDGKVSDINSFYTIAGNSKLKKDDKTSLVVPGVSTFADCLRVCQNSEQLECNYFSFCSDSSSVECRVSALRESNFTDSPSSKERDTKCQIFAMNPLRFYSKAPNRKFKNQISTAIRQSATSCAQECFNSDDCISFQDCGYSCSFNSFYTDSSTEYDEECVIYYPKVSHEYRNTGNKIVSEVIHTEMNLNLDQCASLCHGWTDGDTGCKSFNYCPRNINQMESSCSLTKYSVKSSDTNITEGGYCFNYEFLTSSNVKTNEESSETQVIKGTSGSSAFGIIMMFLVVGSLLGFSAPFFYEKIKSKRDVAQVNESFTWTKQVDEQPGTTN